MINQFALPLSFLSQFIDFFPMNLIIMCY